MARFLILSVMVTLLAGCSEMQYHSSGSFAPVVDSGRGVNRWLSDLHDTRAMSPELQQLTLDAWEQELRDDPSANNCMRLALLLATADEPIGDRKRARELLESFDVWTGSSSDQELVAILLQYLDEQSQSSRKINTLLKQSAEQGRRIEELEQQLQALTTIEQNIQQRDKSGGD